jgi:probable phosphoglycerate mutase
MLFGSFHSMAASIMVSTRLEIYFPCCPCRDAAVYWIVTGSTFILVRHGESEGVHDRLVGRSPGAALTERGRTQLRQTAAYLKDYKIDSYISSPQQRARETAEILAGSGLVSIETAFDECDFGGWTGARFAELAENPEWKVYNELRSLHCAPGGESIADVQHRAVQRILQIRSEIPDGARVCVVTHGDVIRLVLTYFAAAPLDSFVRLHIDTGSVSIVWLGDGLPLIRCVNRIP